MKQTDSECYGEKGVSVGTGSKTLLTPPMILLGLATCSTFFGFQLLLSVVPLYADSAGGGSSGAGLATATFMLATVLAQVQMPRVLSRLGYRAVLAAGLLFLGLPAFFYGAVGDLAPILAVTLVRGVGFGMVTVVFAVVVVELAPPERRGEALGLFGIAITLPTIFCNALGLWLVDHSGYGLVFFLGGLGPLLGLIAVLGVRVGGTTQGESGETSAGFLAGLRRGPLLRLFLLFSASTVAAGVIVTFLPLATPESGPFSAAAALLVVGVTSTASRWWAGRFSDRHDPHLLLVPGLLAGASGMAALSQGGPLLLGGAALFGIGFGLLQNSTLILTMNRVSKAEYGLGSTLWNVAFDAGTGVGAFLFGFVISAAGFSAAFYLSAGLLVVALVLVPLDRYARADSPEP
jgi:predicted MFS family arabinose efflux permease